ncbi:hypothetical protein HPP92_017943 [Vanilla planifolia]|uniref:Uncharacterized protein n=1 Tax=Vanilla planifolia TaxID=51239 RepID=A0A835Q5W0_VANPL|nr:hypothetical protein HPP92_018521 [Vanilla planifolia]KAG0468615.1 hypothetical protein HPP92_017943 [Vanilla planifolia]
MRPGATFAEEHVAHPPASRLGLAGRSAWHSPVPYLFGGLAAMLGLIAFALLILACSYWKLSGFLEGGGDGAPAAGEEGEKAGDSGWKPPTVEREERVVVIMAGEKKPTFLATPVSSRASSFGERTAAAGEGDGECDAETRNVSADADQRH